MTRLEKILTGVLGLVIVGLAVCFVWGESQLRQVQSWSTLDGMSGKVYEQCNEYKFYEDGSYYCKRRNGVHWYGCSEGALCRD